MSPNRIVAFLTPLVFAPLAGAVSAWVADHFPGTNVSQGDLQAIFIGGALIALAPAVQWLHGWQKHEARQAEAERDVELANANSIGMQAALQPADAGQDFEDVAYVDDPDVLAADLSLLVGAEEPTTTLR
jgi:hypothetical protein